MSAGYWSGGGLTPWIYHPGTDDMMAGSPTLAGTLPGAAGMTGQGAYGLVPRTASPQETQTTAIGGNLAAIPSLDTLAQQYSDITARAAAVPFQQVNPYYSQTMAQQGLNAYELAQGILPSSDIQALANSAIANRLSRGIYSGAPNTQAALARVVLGSQLAAQQQGLANLSTLAGLTPKGAQLDLASMMVTPTQQQEWQDIANVRAAAPDPSQAAAANLYAQSLGRNLGQRAVSSGYSPAYTPLTPTTTATSSVPSLWSGVGVSPWAQPYPAGTGTYDYGAGAYETPIWGTTGLFGATDQSGSALADTYYNPATNQSVYAPGYFDWTAPEYNYTAPDYADYEDYGWE